MFYYYLPKLKFGILGYPALEIWLLRDGLVELCSWKFVEGLVIRAYRYGCGYSLVHGLQCLCGLHGGEALVLTSFGFVWCQRHVFFLVPLSGSCVIFLC